MPWRLRLTDMLGRSPWDQGPAFGLEPHVSHALSVPGKIFELVQAVKVIDRNLGYGLRLGEP